MQAINLTISGRGSQVQAPISGTDLVRLLDLQSAISGTAALGHTHTSEDITDFAAAVLTILSENDVPLSGTGLVDLLPGGGLVYSGTQLYVNSGTVSFVGHQHQAADIVDLESAVVQFMGANISGSESIMVTVDDLVILDVNLAPGGALKKTGDGLMVDLGTSHSQAAYGDHTHTQLHDPVTLGAMSSISGTQAGQQFAFELKAVPGGGLLLTGSGVAVDFSVVERTGAGASGTDLSTLDTDTLHLEYQDGVLSGTVPLDPNPPGGLGGRIVAGVGGLRVALGDDDQSAAPGDHVHDVVNSGTDGFMSSADKQRLDALWDASPLNGVEALSTDTIDLFIEGNSISGSVNYEVSPPVDSGRGKLSTTANGLHVVLGTDGNEAAAGDHLHDDRYPVIASGTMVLYPGVTSAPVNLSGVAAWFKAVVGGSEYRIPLYQ